MKFGSGVADQVVDQSPPAWGRGLKSGGVDAVTAFLNAIPAWATNGLSVAGGLLPALGFAVTIMVIGKKRLLPFFILGFALVAYSGINTIGVAVFAICIALLQGNYVQADEEKGVLGFDDDDEEGGF